MWKSFTLLLSLLFATSALAAPALVQSAHSFNYGGGNTSAVFGSNITVNSAIITFNSIESNSITTTITDTRTNSYNVGVTYTLSDASNRSIMHYALGSTAGANTVTSTLSSATGNGLTALEVSGTSLSLDTAVAGGSTSVNAAVTFTPTAGSFCALGIQNDGGNATPPVGYTSVSPDVNNKYMQVAYNASVSGGSQTATWTSGSGRTMVVCLKEASVATLKRMLLLGAG